MTKKLEDAKGKLENFGTVNRCEMSNGKFYVEMTNVNGNMSIFGDLLRCISDIRRELPYIEDIQFDEGEFSIILKKSIILPNMNLLPINFKGY